VVTIETVLKDLLKTALEVFKKQQDQWARIEEEMKKATPLKVQLRPAGMLTSTNGKRTGCNGVFVRFEGRNSLVPRPTRHQKGVWMCWEKRDDTRNCELCGRLFKYEGKGLPEMFYAYCISAATLCMLWKIEEDENK